MDDNPCQFKHASSVVKNQNVLTTQLLELLKVDEEERHEEGRHEEDEYKQEDRQDCRQDEEEYRQDCRQEERQQIDESIAQMGFLIDNNRDTIVRDNDAKTTRKDNIRYSVPATELYTKNDSETDQDSFISESGSDSYVSEFTTSSYSNDSSSNSLRRGDTTDSNDSLSNSLRRSGTSYSDTSHSGLISSDLSDSSTYESDISEFVFKQENRCIQFSKRPISVIKQNKFVKFPKRSISGEQKNTLKTIMHEQAKRFFRLSNVEEATTEKFDKSCFQDVIPSLSTFSSCSSSSKSVITELCSQDNRRIIFCDKPLPEE